MVSDDADEAPDARPPLLADSVEVGGVPIPFANPELLLRMKGTYREKDKVDRAFLTRLVDQRKNS